MPVVDCETGGRIVNDGFGVVVDTPSIMSVLVHEALTHWKVFFEPFTTVPFAHQSGKITGFAQSLRYRSFLSIKRMNPPRGFSPFIVCEGQAKGFQVTGLAKIL